MKYEILFIVRPDLEESKVKDVYKKFETVLTSNGANILSSKELGQKELAYEIKKMYFWIYIRFSIKFINSFWLSPRCIQFLFKHLQKKLNSS